MELPRIVTGAGSKLFNKQEEKKMKTTVSLNDFRDAFRTYERIDSFSYDGLKALHEYLEEYKDGTGEEIELDVISLCCDFSEYNSAIACVNECGYDPEYDKWDTAPEDEKEAAALEYLRNNTMVIEFDGGIIIQAF